MATMLVLCQIMIAADELNSLNAMDALVFLFNLFLHHVNQPALADRVIVKALLTADDHCQRKINPSGQNVPQKLGVLEWLNPIYFIRR